MLANDATIAAGVIGTRIGIETSICLPASHARRYAKTGVDLTFGDPPERILA